MSESVPPIVDTPEAETKNKGGRPRKLIVDPANDEQEMQFLPTDHMIAAEKGPPRPSGENEPEDLHTFDRIRRDGRKSGGQFGLYRYEIQDQVSKRFRTLRAPLHLTVNNLPLTKYETIPSRKRVEELYDDELDRDEVLMAQVDPKTGKSYGWGPHDPARRHAVQAAGKTVYVGNDEREQ